MKKGFKKGAILVGISAMLISLVGCTNNNTSSQKSDEEIEITVE